MAILNGARIYGTLKSMGLALFKNKATFENNVDMKNLPTSDPGVPGRLWNDNGQVRVSLG